MKPPHEKTTHDKRRGRRYRPYGDTKAIAFAKVMQNESKEKTRYDEIKRHQSKGRTLNEIAWWMNLPASKVQAIIDKNTQLVTTTETTETTETKLKENT